MKLVILGAPGAGKGTQAEKIAERFKIPAISTGIIIRQAIRSQTPMGKKAETFIDQGQLLPDDVVIEIVKHRLEQSDCKNGFILDGFPRTVPQAEALENMNIKINKVLSIEVSDATIVARISGRRECISCGASYHMKYKPPKIEGICDLCGAKLIAREDDDQETVLSRLVVYHRQTEPLKDFYKKKNILISVNGLEAIEDTTRDVIKALEEAL